MLYRGVTARRRWAPVVSGVVLLGGVGCVGGCGSLQAPDDLATVRIELSVSGGFAAVNWGFTVDGGERRIVGGPCDRRINCDWDEGEVLGTFERQAMADLVAAFFARGFFNGPSDYGNQCCDQFFYALTFADGSEDRTVMGSDGTLPPSIQGLVQIVEQFLADARG